MALALQGGFMLRFDQTTGRALEMIRSMVSAIAALGSVALFVSPASAADITIVG
jgi:hypothetical protein